MESVLVSWWVCSGSCQRWLWWCVASADEWPASQDCTAGVAQRDVLYQDGLGLEVAAVRVPDMEDRVALLQTGSPDRRVAVIHTALRSAVALVAAYVRWEVLV